MCVVAVAWQAHPRWRLIVAGNRDEFHDRPADPLARWPGPTAIIAGRDRQSGGTWMGVSDAGRCAILTNVRTGVLPNPDKLSRGSLVPEALVGRAIGTSPLEGYNPFNLLICGPEGARCLTNTPEPSETVLAPGVHGLSNGKVGLAWPRRDRLVAMLNDWMSGHATQPETLLRSLEDRVGVEGGEGEAPIFLVDPVYGTRCSTVIAVDADGRGLILEQRRTPKGDIAGRSQFEFDWSGGEGARND